MANIKSAKKRVKVIAAKTAVNRNRKSQIKTGIRKFENALAEGNFDAANLELRFVEKKLDRAASKNTIHKNAAAKKISRLRSRLNQAQKA